MTLSAFTAVPGCRRIRSTRPWVVAGIQRIWGQGCQGRAPRGAGTAFDRVNPDRRALNARRGGLKTRQSERNQPDNGETDDRVDRPANSLVPTIRRSSDVHTVYVG